MKTFFSKAFKRLKKDNEYNIDAAKAEKIYQGVLKEVFNASMEAALHVDVLKGLDGEIGLRVGSTPDYFGLIFVGDTKKVAARRTEDSESGQGLQLQERSSCQESAGLS